MVGFDFVVASQAAIEGEPGVGSFDDPAAWQNGKARRLSLVDDFQSGAAPQAHGMHPIDEFAGVAAIGPDDLQPAEPAGFLQKELGPVTRSWMSAE